jgi:RNA methyltransferase, TrmH family
VNRPLYEVSSLRLPPSPITVPLTSIHNPRLQEIRKAARTGRPTPDGLIVAEGPHLLADVLRSRWHVSRVYCTPGALVRFAGLLSDSPAEVAELSERVFTSLTATETTQGILLLLRPRDWSWPDLIGRDLTAACPLVVLLDSMQDPGNVGSIARSAEAFGATGIVLTEGCARVSNGKVLRAAAGSLFRIPYLENVPHAQITDHLSASKLPLYALAGNGQTALAAANFRLPCVLAVGNEGAGISPELVPLAQTVRIPTVRVESLNAGVAAAIALFEAARQRDLA